MHDTNDVNEALAALRQAGQHPDGALLDRVKALGPAAVRPLIAMATDESLHNAGQDSPEVWAPLHAIQVLGELEAAEAVEPLLPLLAWDDDWLGELLPQYLGRIGRPALPPLRAYLFDRTHEDRARSRAAEALTQMAQHHPELRADVVAALEARLDPAQTQAADDERLNAFVVGNLLDLKAGEAAPAIRRAFDEDRVDRRIVDVDRVYQELDLPGRPPTIRADRDKGLRLWLRCTACGYERDHYVEKVYCDAGTIDRRKRGEEVPYSEFIIPKRIACPKCGAVDQYELTGDAHLAFTAQLLMSLARGKRPKPAGGPVGKVVEALANVRKDHGDLLPADDEEEDRVVYTRFTVAGGREMHPLEAVDMYSRQVEAEPDNADLRLRYGNVLRFLGRREEAMLQYRAALQADPANVEVCASLGTLAREAGDRTEARRMLQRVLELAPDSKMSRQDRAEYVQFAREELAELDGPAGKPRRTELAVAPGPDRRGSAAGQPSAPQHPVRHAGKVGRNDPCPCGSGKKIKKCCGR